MHEQKKIDYLDNKSQGNKTTAPGKLKLYTNQRLKINKIIKILLNTVSATEYFIYICT